MTKGGALQGAGWNPRRATAYLFGWAAQLARDAAYLLENAPAICETEESFRAGLEHGLTLDAEAIESAVDEATNGEKSPWSLTRS